ncbi:MAG TPA: CsgG/HfaB family protein [Polyangiales bacterium]
MRLFVFLVTLALTLTAYAAPTTTTPTVAVIYFDYQGKSEELAPLKKGLASMLISDLAGSDAYRVVERERLEDVLAELKLQASAKIDQATAVKAGKLLGAHYLVLGSYFDVMKQLRIDARIVEVETGRVLRSAGATGQPEDFVGLEQKLANELARHLGETAKPLIDKPVKGKPKTVLVKNTRDAGAPDAGEARLIARPKPPKKLDTKTAADYGRALSALDAHDLEAAKTTLKKVMARAPDFELASLDLNRLMKQ